MNVDQTLCDYNFFLTGASGFIGTVLLHRLLNIENASDCKIFCLLRSSKKYATVSERLSNEVLRQEIFGLSDEQICDLLLQKRVVGVEGELTEELLAIDDKAMAHMKYAHDVNHKKGIVVIHCAADIDFNREINQSININVNGTYQCIQVAHELNAKCFIHISTLYVNSREDGNSFVAEKIYDSGLNFVDEFQKWLKLRAENEQFSASYINRIKGVTSKQSPLQRQEWPNNYTFTKNMAENVVRHYCRLHSLSYSMIRLGIVSPILGGKHLGWFMGNGGFVFLVIGIATGNICYLNGNGQGRPDFVPVDYTCDTILGVTTATVLSKQQEIYQCGVIAADKEFSVSNCVQHAKPIWMSLDLPYCTDTAGLTFIQSKTLFYFVELILYEIPLFLLSCLSLLLSTVFSLYFWIKLYYQFTNQLYEIDLNNFKNLTLSEQIRSLQMILYDKPYAFVKRTDFMKKARAKLNWFNANYTYFVNQRWHFDHSNVKALYAALDNASQTKYDFDVNKIHFNKYANDAALVCFNKYIKYREEKKEAQIKFEQDLKHQLDMLIKQQQQERQTAAPQTRSLTKDEKLQILQVLRKLFGMLGLDIKLSLCIFVGMALIAAFSFAVL
eukprot:CAMPEP_0197057500 /NCGR_PEP_ID=MMETSP1384-20130603/97718_1 /TAXON_ID=29189 /ORGANISM="Ammonia sp." /LENGTH=612 /DNA_ID=CAMNT_0042491947 /DNA_START=49 /DNA_END=1887 /DNA_ORIENTATION=-